VCILLPVEAKIKRTVSIRLPLGLVERLDFVVRNSDSDTLTDRSRAILAAVRAWLPAQEDQLRKLGLTPPEGR